MFILPYIHKKTTINTITVNSYTILTIGGKELWQEDSNHIKQIIEENDIYTDSIIKKDNIYICKVNQEKTNISDFYKWNEITDSKFCWRTLYTFGENQLWLPHPHETMSGYSYQTLCELISI